MKILFDHNVPRPLRKRLLPHFVTTAAQLGWARLSNGDLIQAAERAGFEVFLTGDHGILYQQNHVARRIPIVLLSDTYWPWVDTNVHAIVEALAGARAGSFTIVTINKLEREDGTVGV